MSATKPGLNGKNTVDTVTSVGYVWSLWERLSDLLTSRSRESNAVSVLQSALPCSSSYKRPVLTVFDRLFVDPAAFPEEPEEAQVFYEERDDTNEPDPDDRNPMRLEFPSWRNFFG